MEHGGKGCRGREKGKGKCRLGVGRGRDGNGERPAKREPGCVGKLRGLLGPRAPLTRGAPRRRGGLPSGGFSLQSGPGRGTESAVPPSHERRPAGPRRPSRRGGLGGEPEGLRGVTRGESSQLPGGRAPQRGTQGGRAGRRRGDGGLEGGWRRGAEDGPGCGRRAVLPFWPRVSQATPSPPPTTRTVPRPGPK